MVTNTVKDGKLYNLVWDDFAEYLVKNTSYEVYFISSGFPKILVTKENFAHFKTLNNAKSECWNNQFIVAFDLPQLKIEIDQDDYEKHKLKISSYNGFKGINYSDNKEVWKDKEIDKRYQIAVEPLREAHSKGENPVWDIDLDKIGAEVDAELDKFLGIKK